jgi:hypothetical protein
MHTSERTPAARRRTAHLSLRLTRQDREALALIAKREDAPASQIARVAIRRELERRR